MPLITPGLLVVYIGRFSSPVGVKNKLGYGREEVVRLFYDDGRG